MGRRPGIAILFAALTISVYAQRQKVATVKPAAPPGPSVVDLSVEPAQTERRATPVTLREAAEANDFAAFEAIYRRAVQRREPLGAFADLHEVWSYAENEAAGSFFGAELFARISSRYPDFAAFIREYRVIDRSGNAFYPTRETRRFLLAQAIADVDPIVVPIKAATQEPKLARPAAPGTEEAKKGPALAKAAEPRQLHAVQAAPVASEKQAVTAGSYAPPVTEPPPSADALSNDIAQASTSTRDPGKGDFTAADVMTGNHTRGIFLIIVGLLGIGFLTVMMQASPGEVHVEEDPEENAESHG